MKLLDFGVARHRPIADATGTDATHDGARATIEGALVGTVQYMAPEQLEGRTVDARTDIFAFGAVLFEMATGQRAFAGTSAAGLAAAILGESRPRLPEAAGLPPALGRVISVCLARDPDERWQNAGDLLRALKWIDEDAGDARAAAGIAPSRRWIVHVGLGGCTRRRRRDSVVDRASSHSCAPAQSSAGDRSDGLAVTRPRLRSAHVRGRRHQCRRCH